MIQPRILTFNFHEPYLCLMAKTGLDFDLGRYESGPLARDWQVHFRSMPANLHEVPEAEWRARIQSGHYDVVIAHNEMNAIDVFQARSRKLLICHNRRSFVVARARTDEGDPVEVFGRLIRRLAGAFDFIFISESKQADYGLPGRVILPGIDVEEFGGYRGETPAVLRVGNAMTERTLMFDVGLQEEVCRGLPSRIAGVNPDLPGSAHAASYEALLELYRGHRCMLHVSREEYEDGYNLAMLEAMACGMPVVALQNRTSPLKDGVDGYLSYDPWVLRRRLVELLDDPDHARTLGAHARETVARAFPIQKFTEQWREAIFEAAESGGRPRKKGSIQPKAEGRPQVLMHYLSNPLTTGRYFELAAQPSWDILTTGYRLPEEVLKFWGFEPAPPPYPKFLIDLPLHAPYDYMLRQLPQDYRGDLYFYVDHGGEKIEPGIEFLDMPKIAYLIDVHVIPEYRLAMARHFDVVFLAQKAYVLPFREAGIRHTYWMPLACWPPLHDLGPRERHYDVAYVGGLSTEESDRRRVLMDGVAARFPNHRIGKAWPEEMAQIYAESRIVANACINRDVNMRVFEALASGALLITDEAEGLEDLFEDRKHLVIYRNDAELPGLIDYYLQHSEERERIAAAGRELVLREHTYTHRIRAIERQTEAILGPLHHPERRLKKQADYYEQPRRELLPYIPMQARRVLDIGCGAGALGRTLKEERGTQEVAGVEIVEEAARKAQEVLDQVFTGSIEEIDLPFEEGHFDCIVCADVLEHLIDPEAALGKLARLLAPDGVIVMSVPNARFFEVLAVLSSGAWPYQDAGILDYTHFRWFTRASLPGFVAAAGLEAVEIQPLSMMGPAAVTRGEEGEVRLHKIVLHDVSDHEIEELRTYQFVVLACKPGADRLERARIALAESQNEAALDLALDAIGVDPFEQRRIAAKALARLGELLKAEQCYREALELREDPDVMGEYGTLLLGMSRPGPARTYLERCLAVQPDNARALGALGLLQMGEGHSEEAFASLLSALGVDFGQVTLIPHAIALARALGRAAELIERLRAYVDYYAGDLDLACTYAQLLIDMGQQEEARERLDMVLMFKPDHPQANALQQRLNGEALE